MGSNPTQVRKVFYFAGDQLSCLTKQFFFIMHVSRLEMVNTFDFAKTGQAK